MECDIGWLANDQNATIYHSNGTKLNVLVVQDEKKAFAKVSSNES